MHRIGFLTQLVGPAQLEDEVSALSTDLASMARIPLKGMKRHLNRIARGTLDADELEAEVRRAYMSADLREGQAAWKEKRSPRFGGK